MKPKKQFRQRNHELQVGKNTKKFRQKYIDCQNVKMSS